jgi:hypothetical protein
MLHAQTTSKPENGFISPAKYTNAFFGFSLPLPQDAQLKPVSQNAPPRSAFRHILFAANSTAKGYPFVMVGADEINSSNADPKKTLFGTQKIDVVQIAGKEFSRSRWKGDDNIYRVMYGTTVNAYMLFITTFTYDAKVLGEFERNIQALTFFDPTKAQEFAGPDAEPYEGPPLRPTAATPGVGQQGTNADTEMPPRQPAAGLNATPLAAANPGQFYDKDLALHFNYPIEMRSLDASAEMERGHQNIYGVSGANDPEHLEAKRCGRPLLDAELPEDKAPQRPANLDGVWVDDSKEYKESRKPVPIYANVFMMEVVRSCLPQQLQKNENDALASIALSLVSEPGIQRMPKPLWYEIGKQKIHMNSGAGRPIINGQLASAPIMIMSMATQWRGHLLAWAFTSNDTEIFNEITKSQVQFGDGPWGPMFAPNVGPQGSGTPMTILPK